MTDWITEGDILIVDRGFWDAVDFLEEMESNPRCFLSKANNAKYTSSDSVLDIQNALVTVNVALNLKTWTNLQGRQEFPTEDGRKNHRGCGGVSCNGTRGGVAGAKPCGTGKLWTNSRGRRKAPLGERQNWARRMNKRTWNRRHHRIKATRRRPRHLPYRQPNLQGAGPRTQQSGESVSKYYTELKLIAAHCGYGALEESLIRDQIVCGIKDTQAELDETALVWNMHRIRRSSSNLPDDRPIALYLLPVLWASADYVQSISDDELEICKSECAHDDPFPCEEELFELGCLYMRANQVDPPTNINECKALYLGLRQWLLSHL
ncbi:Hypothetical predicted protein [Mytilus galloprovincialis]|uniref:Uncharacterized protein n=1 Tax=Mytilus galloprovincialis TaxID=29158 RepID=A0A8B6BR96_MYTGA|nr:Hypothetical predicted protein [Mytilus galloprovincialis]